jgi:hypothetical protein
MPDAQNGGLNGFCGNATELLPVRKLNYARCSVEQPPSIQLMSRGLPGTWLWALECRYSAETHILNRRYSPTTVGHCCDSSTDRIQAYFVGDNSTDPLPAIRNSRVKDRSSHHGDYPRSRFRHISVRKSTGRHCVYLWYEISARQKKSWVDSGSGSLPSE